MFEKKEALVITVTSDSILSTYRNGNVIQPLLKKRVSWLELFMV